MKSKDIQAAADRGMAVLDAWADLWTEEVKLTSIIKDLTLPGPKAVGMDGECDKVRNRIEAQIYTLVRQAFQEGALAAISNLGDEHDKLRALGFSPKEPNVRKHP